jgi:outer membrane receptor protein involved in Fe transport
MRYALRYALGTFLAVLAHLGCSNLQAQTTQGLISGRILNSVTGRPVAGASISWSSTTLAASGIQKSDEAGYYFLPLLSAGTYSLRAVADTFQSQELQQLELPVAASISLDFRLRPLNDVWESGQYRSVFLPGAKTVVTFYGPDVDTSRSGSFTAQQGQRGALDTSASYVVTPQQIEDLPLAGRDVYTMLVSLPGVTADSGTARGLGVSVSGARPSASNYLLDGVENDNYLVTGPLSPVAPEAIQEYRISTNNYSAEYGRTGGFVANAVTRAGDNGYHGNVYWYLKNDALNATDFADNLNGLGRRPEKEHRIGYQAGGPIRRGRLFFSSSLESLTSHSKLDAEPFYLPTANFIPALNIPPSRTSYKLLTMFPPPVIQSQRLVAPLTIAAPVEVTHLIALERGDYSTSSGRDRFMTRLVLSRLKEPDFSWSPYPDFITPLQQNTTGIAGNWTRALTPRITSELKLSYSDDDLWWDRAHPEIPTLVSGDGTILPGSPLFYSYKNHNRSFESIYSVMWTRRKHVVTAGAGLLFRANSGYLTAGRDGEYLFNGPLNFAFDQPSSLYAAVDRLSGGQPDFNRSYRYAQNYFFVQDSYRVSARLTLNFGLRYERYGAPTNNGTSGQTGSVKDALVTLGSGSDFNARLASATLVRPGAGDQSLYGADNSDFAPRIGFSWDPFGKSRTVLRGGYGLFYDRPFDNLWQNIRNNNVQLPQIPIGVNSFNYLQPIAGLLPSSPVTSPVSNFPSLTLVDPNLRNGYAQDFFLGAQHIVRENLTIEATGTGALGRRLMTTDIVNRQFTVLPGTGRPNETMPDIAWRSSQGKSNYFALSSLVKYRLLDSLDLQAAYTWSHSIDNQSDPLTGDFFDLNFTTVTGASATATRSAFARQFDSQGDRGNSDFDQRHNLFLTGTWRSTARPILLSGWRVSGLSAFRTGFPYSILSITTISPINGNGLIQNQRADLIDPAAAILATPKPVAGGVQLLDPAAFAEPRNPSLPGNTGRNSFRGPGLYNVDLSVSRTFSGGFLRFLRLPEQAVLTFRADAFNLLNHANLNNPDNLYNPASTTFGIATFGRQGTASGFPAVAPLNETARQIQLLVRLEF